MNDGNKWFKSDIGPLTQTCGKILISCPYHVGMLVVS